MEKISLPQSWHRLLFILGLMVLVVGLPFSSALMSIGIIWLSVNFIWEGNFESKWKKYLLQPAAFLLTAVFILHVLGLFWTENVARGIHDLRIKLPLLALPIIFSASRSLNKNQLSIVLHFYLASCFLISALSYSAFLGIIDVVVNDSRDYSLFIDHIRFSLFLVIAILCSVYYLIVKKGKHALIYFFLILFFTGVIAIMRAGTALTVLGLLCGIFVVGLFIVKNALPYAIAIRSAGLLIILAILGFVVFHAVDFYTIRQESIDEVEHFSKSGNPYVFDQVSHKLENGYWVNWYVQEQEMEATWNEVSNFHYTGEDKNGSVLKATLKRYLTSKGLRKDREGVLALSQTDIAAIESGIANMRFLPPHTLGDRAYQIMWEIHGLRAGDNPQGNSVGQRFLFWKMGLRIFKSNFVFGVGTGDVKDTFDAAYNSIDFYIQEQFRHRAHNQYITIGIALGIIGVILFVSSLAAPFVFEKVSANWFFLAVFVVLIFSMINEDTLETQAGATLFAFWWSFVLWAFPKSKEESK